MRGRIARLNLFVAFAFTVMADPVSSVAYALEAALRHLEGDLGSLLLTMTLVMGTIALVAAGYHQLIRRFPKGGGGAEGLAAAFGESWAFLPVGALLVDFTLTIGVSVAAASSALVAWAPSLAGGRTALAIGLAAVVGGVSALGHRGRIAFATATLAFAVLGIVVIARGIGLGAVAGSPPPLADASAGPAVLAMPLAMALATGVEAPSNAIAQLGQLDDAGRRRFGQATIWIMLALVTVLSLGFALVAMRRGVGEPGADSTFLADVARAATGHDAMFGAFQVTSTLLLLSAASSSFLAGSGLLKALALHGADGEGLVPRRFGITNRFLFPPWGGALLLALAVGLLAAAGAHEQRLVPYYAVAVFASFLGALTAAARLAQRERRFAAAAFNAFGGLVVAFVLALNLGRLDGLVALGASTAISLYVWRVWVARGRAGGSTGTLFRHAEGGGA